MCCGLKNAVCAFFWCCSHALVLGQLWLESYWFVSGLLADALHTAGTARKIRCFYIEGMEMKINGPFFTIL
jgi:hypothetical protein